MYKLPLEILDMPVPEGFEWSDSENFFGIRKRHWWHWWVWKTDTEFRRSGETYAHRPDGGRPVLLASFNTDFIAAANYMSIKSMLGQYE